MDPKDKSFVPYRLAGSYLQKQLARAGLPLPQVGIICGSGLSGLSDTLQEPKLTVPYKDIPGFPAHCTVAGHKGEVVFGSIVVVNNNNQKSTVPTICFRGRFHSYEGHDMKVTVLPVYVMRCLNVRICLITNAAGALNPAYKVGDVLAISDHLAIPQLAGKNPLIGPNDDELGPRFPATSNAYPEELRNLAVEAAQQLGMDFVQPNGVYCFVSGPMYESKAECRFLRSLGGDCVGMSTIPEVVAAHHCNMKALCLSLMTNQVVTDDKAVEVATHAEVLEAVAQRSKQLQDLVQGIVGLLHQRVLPKLPPLRKVTLDLKAGVERDFFRTQSTASVSFPMDDDDDYEDYQGTESNRSSTGVHASSLVLGAAIFALGAVFGTTVSTRTRGAN